MAKHNKKEHGDMLMICGALHDIAEIVGKERPPGITVNYENIAGYLRICEAKLEKITLEQISTYERRRKSA